MKRLKTLNFNSIFSLKSSAKTIEKSINIKPVKTIFTDINMIKTNTSLVDTIGLMKYVDTPKDLKTIGKISSKYGTNTKGVMKVLGKGALRAGKSIVKFTTKLLWRLGGLLLSILGFLTMLILKYRGLKKLKGIAA